MKGLLGISYAYTPSDSGPQATSKRVYRAALVKVTTYGTITEEKSVTHNLLPICFIPKELYVISLDGKISIR